MVGKLGNINLAVPMLDKWSTRPSSKNDTNPFWFERNAEGVTLMSREVLNVMGKNAMRFKFTNISDCVLSRLVMAVVGVCQLRSTSRYEPPKSTQLGYELS